MIPPAVGQRDETHSRFDEPAGEQHALSGLAGTVIVAELLRLVGEGEGGAGFLRGNHGVGTLIEGIHAVERVRFLDRAEVGIDSSAHLAAGGEALFGDAIREAEVADFEILGRRIIAEAERTVSRAEVASAGEGVWDGRNANVGRKVVLRAQLVRDDAAKAGILERRAGAIASEHVVRAAIMVGLAVGHGANNSDLVRNLGRVRHQLGEVNAAQLRLHRAERASIFNRREQLGVKRFLRRHASRQVNLNNGLRGRFRSNTRSGGCGLELEEISHRQPQRADRAGEEELAAARTPGMFGAATPGRNE